MHELIGGIHPAGGWQMHAFDEADSPSMMRLSQESLTFSCCNAMGCAAG